ncbi:MAG: hypothetical protein J6S67_21445 [Methanobrevibacter sp.]|nr:hypothetical protein [Methanobrevibacter sp.]
MGNPYNCVDVSEWNGDIDWQAAANDDVRFAFIRAGFGQDIESQDDKYFHINMENAIKAGVKIGVYFYSYATSREMAIGEALHCLRLIEPYKDKIAFPVFYDLEEDKIASHLEEIVPAFIDTLNEHGYNAGVYCTGYWYSKYFRPISCSYFWLAYWGNNDGQPHDKPDYCDVWQYTSKGSVHGIGYDCVDCDILYNEDMKLLIDKPDKKNIYIDISVPEDCNVYINNQLIDVNKHIEG